MPRHRRLIPCNAFLHVISRGNNKQAVFHTDNDKLRYYTLLSSLKNENKISVLHYCLMDNHIHLLLSLNAQSSVSKFMKQVNLTYALYYRKLYGYFGYLWQGRFKSNIIDEDSYLLQCGKYIELNPVRAGLVDEPSKYIFSSYNFCAHGKSDSLVSYSPAYLGLSDQPDLRRKRYIDFVIDKSIINSETFAHKLFIGSQDFINKLQEYYGTKENRIKRGRPHKDE